MGFWHTGYMEFHEPVGLGDRLEWSPPTFPCTECERVFSLLEDLRRHRFEAHPLRRPVMFLRGRELGTNPVRITRRLSSREIWIEGCDRALLNGEEVSVRSLPEKLAEVTMGVCHIVLGSLGVNAEFELDICVASEADLVGVEGQFRTMALGRRLDTRALEGFISAASGFRSAVGYCDGICEYLYGVLLALTLFRDSPSSSSLFASGLDGLRWWRFAGR